MMEMNPSGLVTPGRSSAAGARGRRPRAEHDATVTELTAPLPISMPAVSRHLKVLERAALISRTRSGKWRGSRLQAAPLRDAADWIDRYQRFWDSSLTRLDGHLAAVQAAERATDRMANDPKVPDNQEL